MKKNQLLPNVITAFALSCGLYVIFKISMIAPGTIDFHLLSIASGLLLLAALADVLDGAVARAMKGESEFGAVFDSMADAISFGVAPSVIVLKTFSMEAGSNLSFLLSFATMVFSVCGVLRLVRFNISSQAAKGDEALQAANKKHFTGLPIPAAAAAIVSLNLFMMSDEFGQAFSLPLETRAWVLFFALLILGYFMVSRWKFPSIKTLQIRVASFQLVFMTVLAAAIIFYGIFHHFAVVFFSLTWLYVVLALGLSIARVIAGKRSKALEEFEPDPEDFD